MQLDGSGGNGAVNYSWTQLAGPAGGLIPNNQVVNPSFDAPFVSANKTLTFELIVDDGAGSFSDPDTVDVSVVNTNTPPVADAGDDATVKEGAETILDGSHSFDPEGDPLGYQWMQTTGPPVILQPSSMVASPSFTAPFGVGNQLTFELVIDDGKEFGASDEVIVTVVANSIPTADAGPDQTVDEGTLVNLDGTLSSDLDGGDTLTFEWTGPAALSDSTSPTPSFTAPFVGSGGEALEFTLIVTDDDAVSPKSSAPDHVTINVRNLSDPPSCDLARAYCPESSIAPDGCTLWPPNHKLLTVGIVGIADPDSDDNHVTVQITGVTQDEPLTDGGAGSTSPDAVIQDGDPADSVLIRAERSGQGDGRVYVVHFTADDGFDSCNGSVTIGVPHDRKDIPVDTGQIYDSTQP